MKMYLPFGDWSGDGHCVCEKVLINAPSMEHLLEAQKRIKVQYGSLFFDNFANEYQDAVLGDEIWDALEDANYPIERLAKYDDINDWVGIKSIQEGRGYHIGIEAVMDMFIWLLNAHGAQIIRLDEKEDIPMICNWNCPGFKTVGYGCFDY